MPLIRPADWEPVGVASLESNADEVVRSDDNTLVVAGPGAGKTELLAQRAHYLLTDGAVPSTASHSRNLVQTRRRSESSAESGGAVRSSVSQISVDDARQLRQESRRSVHGRATHGLAAPARI